jgi:hypothetical protein
MENFKNYLIFVVVTGSLTVGGLLLPLGNLYGAGVYGFIFLVIGLGVCITRLITGRWWNF